MNNFCRVIVENITISPTSDEREAFQSAKKILSGIKGFGRASGFGIYKKSVDARRKDNIKLVCSVYAEVENSGKINRDYLAKKGIKLKSDVVPSFDVGSEALDARPAVVGFGPAGMFAALFLAEYGYRPVVFERGGCVDDRVAAVEKFNREGILDSECNIQFGAGGAGTFSDGKLTTRISDPYVTYVLSKLRDMGSPEDVTKNAKPHIGTDVLRDVVKNFHREIERLGGEVRYNSRVDSVGENYIVVKGEKIKCSAVILATGHSARDVYDFAVKNGFSLEMKPFSVGVRIEHLTRDIDYAMYGSEEMAEILGHADYSLSMRRGDRGVYSFCMCPGGTVVGAASEHGGVVTNGMSCRLRDGVNSNAAIAVSVLPSDLGSDIFSGVEFQRRLERAAYAAGGSDYTAPTQRFGDFVYGKVGRISERIRPSYRDGKVTPCDFNTLFPEFVSSMLKEGIDNFGRKIKGFSDRDVPLTGVETRTSAPLRILRDENFEAIGKKGIYPCGEGAGYAGGIVSAAVDGIRTARAVISKYKPFD